MSAQTAKITPEVFRVTVHPNDACAYVDGQGTSMGEMAVCYRGDGDHIQRAKLIAEAFNVCHETGLTPRQLADQRAELLGLLQELIDIEGPQPGTAEWASKVRAAIAKATGEQP